MENSTQIVSFVLTMYGKIGNLKYLYFTLAMLLYMLIIFTNIGLIAIIYIDRNLHEPMYLFLCSLFVNEIYGSTTLLPCLMIQVLSEIHDISLFYCFIQIFSMHTYAAVEYGNLTIMAYDRYVCICKPLHYNAIITKARVQRIILAVWIISFVEVAVLFSFTVSLKFCGNIIDRFNCENHLVAKLSCSLDTTMSDIHDLIFGLVFSVGPPVGFISFSYIKILVICLKSSKETRKKAFTTCTPHLVSLLNFAFGCFYELITQRFDTYYVPYPLRVCSSLYLWICQPLLSPVMYGLKLSQIRHAWKNLLTSKMK